MSRVLNYVYLRLYALTLGRSSRNSPNDACDDAIMLTGMVLMVPLGFVLTGIAILVPYVGEHIVSVGSVSVALLAVVPIMYGVKRKFNGYRRNPAAAARYSARNQRIATFVFFLGLLMTAPVAFGILLRILVR
jgi:hypothetical protein